MQASAKIPDPTPPAASAIGDYALIGDCRTAALVALNGSIDWLCLPSFSGPSIFAAILDQEKGGAFSIRPSGPFRSTRRYVGDTAILETTFETDDGVVRLTDLMPVTDDLNGLRPMREILRFVEGVSGRVAMAVHCEPRPDYARTRPRVRPRGALGHAFLWGSEALMLHGDFPLRMTPDGLAVAGAITLEAGQSICFSLTYANREIGVVAPRGEAARARQRETAAWWTAWSARCSYSGPYHALVVRSAVTLKLMTFALSGAVVAAPTTSLPEEIGAGHNWDYRFCWLRDAALTMKAFVGLGYRQEAEAFLRWLLHATRLTWPRLQVMYDVYGRTNLVEKELDHLAGYAGSRPVRIGNGAHDQLQLDVYGGVVSAVVEFVEDGGVLQADEGRLLAGFGDVVCKIWREPDNGIWEIRGARRHFTFSKVMCWAALDGLIRLHKRGVLEVDVDRLGRERDAIAEAIETRCYNEAVGSYVIDYDGDKLDAAVLLMCSLHYKSAADRRMKTTLRRIQEKLGRNGLLDRYDRSGEGKPIKEGAFGICGFWAIENLAHQGGAGDEARRGFEHLTTFSNDVGLMSEETNPETGAALGNFPQAFTHVGLINAALALEKEIAP